MRTEKRAAIIGGGVIGGGWAARFLLNGWDVTVFDPESDAERKISEVLDNARRSLPALSDVTVPREGTLTYAGSIGEAVADADWIQESVPERLDIKHMALADIQAHCGDDALIGSSTSGYKPSELQVASARPEQIFVAHPFNPVYLLPLVELVGDPQTTERARAVIDELGMKPLVVRKEIDAHIADRFLEAVWREALWLVKDSIAGTEEIDDAIRFGFGLRWAQMGLFETFRIAGGEAGMRHFIAQFGPHLASPWTKLMDVPELTDELAEIIAHQSELQSGHYSIRDLERIRDDNLVAMMRALKQRDWGAGAVLAAHDEAIKPPLPTEIDKPLITLRRVIPIDWTDYNKHMNESRYGQVFSDAGDVVMAMVGADREYVEAGNSYFTAYNHVTYRAETNAGDAIFVRTHVLEAKGKKLKMYHEMMREDDRLLATCEQLLLHVSLKTRRTCEPGPEVAAKLDALHAAQTKLPKPESKG